MRETWQYTLIQHFALINDGWHNMMFVNQLCRDHHRIDIIPLHSSATAMLAGWGGGYLIAEIAVKPQQGRAIFVKILFEVRQQHNVPFSKALVDVWKAITGILRQRLNIAALCVKPGVWVRVL